MSEDGWGGAEMPVSERGAEIQRWLGEGVEIPGRGAEMTGRYLGGVLSFPLRCLRGVPRWMGGVPRCLEGEPPSCPLCCCRRVLGVGQWADGAGKCCEVPTQGVSRVLCWWVADGRRGNFHRDARGLHLRQTCRHSSEVNSRYNVAHLYCLAVFCLRLLSRANFR